MTSPLAQARRVDVAAVMALIRDENARRVARGLLTEEEVRSRADARFRRWAEHAHIDPRLLDRFLAPGHDWNVASDYIVRTHRKGLVAHLSLLAKRVVNPVVRLYTDHVIDRQAQINQYLVRVLHEAVRENVRLEARVAGLEAEAQPEPDPGLSAVADAVGRRWRQEAIPDGGDGS
jgi:hypothetical protein